MNLVAIDIETYDPNLKTMGDGACRDSNSPDDDGSCILCVGTFDGYKAKAYIPFTEDWSKEFIPLMNDSSIKKVFHNGIYDLGWLACGYDVPYKGELHDTMTRMVYIDEYAKLDLDSCCKRFRVEGKNKDETIEKWYDENIAEVIALANTYNYKIKKADGLWKHSLFLFEHFPEFREAMIKYNLQDCRATWYLYQAQESLIEKVMEPYMIDVKLTPCIIDMKKRGVRIDLKAFKQLRETVHEYADAAETNLRETYGITPDMVSSPKKLGQRMHELGIHSTLYTSTGAESWSALALERIEHPVIDAISTFKNYNTLLTRYLEGDMARAILSDGRIHCTFSPNKREEGGAVTGRFACSHPNLQNIPAHGKHQHGHRFGQDMRALFIPEEGCMMGAFDYSQVEYLLLANFAKGPKGEWFREQCRAGVDFHSVAMQATGINNRHIIKQINYGVIYGMGWQTAKRQNYALFEKLAAEQGMDIDTFSKKTFNDYHARLPVIRDTIEWAQKVSEVNGYIKTIGGRYQHKPKPQYDPATGKVNTFLYKMLNKLIQGSAADILKFAMLKCYEDGLFDILPFHITVHDENVISIPFNKIGVEAAQQLKDNMEQSFHKDLHIPMKVDAEVGPNWGYWSGDIWEEMKKGNFDPKLFEKSYKDTHD